MFPPVAVGVQPDAFDQAILRLRVHLRDLGEFAGEAEVCRLEARPGLGRGKGTVLVLYLGIEGVNAAIQV